VRLVRFLVGAGAAAAAAYIVVARRADDSAAWSEYPATQDWYPAAQLDGAFGETAATTAPEAPSHELTATPVETGHFSMRGCAAAPGHAVVTGVTFRRRLPKAPSPDVIQIEVDATSNVPDGGLLILRDGGFAPTGDGFALMLAAAATGPFSASGTYRVFAS
jgi:hypothetical protein